MIRQVSLVSTVSQVMALRKVSHDRLARIRARAPKHPAKPEQHIRNAVFDLFFDYHEKIRSTVAHYALRYLANRKQRSLSAANNPMMHSVFQELSSYARHKLITGNFRDHLAANAKATADSATKQVAYALDQDKIEADLSDETDRMVASLYDMTESYTADSIERVQDVLDEWAELDPDLSPRYGSLDSLDDMLSAGLAGIAGSALASAGLTFAYAWGQMNKSAQKQEGVGQYAWIAQHDSAVRPEHLALDGEVASWDDPPLSAEDSTNGEDDHAGEDINCRCIASPIPPDEEDENV